METLREVKRQHSLRKQRKLPSPYLLRILCFGRKSFVSSPKTCLSYPQSHFQVFSKKKRSNVQVNILKASIQTLLPLLKHFGQISDHYLLRK